MIVKTLFPKHFTKLSASRSCHKTHVQFVTPKDLPDDDETPQRLTATQTATMRGVMVPGSMGPLDFALRGAWPENQR